MTIQTIQRIICSTILALLGKWFVNLSAFWEALCLKSLLSKVFSVKGQNQPIQLSLSTQDLTVIIDETQFFYLNVEYGFISSLLVSK